jgi:hypothetical protein
MQPATIAGGYTIRLAAKPWLGVTIPNSGQNRKVTLANIGNGDLSQEFGFSYGYQGSPTVVPNAWVASVPANNNSKAVATQVQSSSNPNVPQKTTPVTSVNSKKNQPVIMQTSGFGGIDVFDLNPLSENFSTLNIGSNQRVKVNVSAPGTPGSYVFHTYTYFNKSQGTDFIYGVKKFKINAKTAKELSYLAGVDAFFAKVFNSNPFIAVTSILASIYYENMTEQTIVDAEYCLGKDSGFWIDAKGGILFLDQQLKCDK